jgi:hypothetical protein
MATALSPGTDLLVPAAARTSRWVTDLYLLNLGGNDTEVTLHWLVRGQANPDPPTLQLTLSPSQTRVLEDVVRTGFGFNRGTGALRITASDRIVATCRIFAADGAATYGQGFEGVPADTATTAGTSTHVIGVNSSDAFRTNLYALALGGGATVEAALHDPSGVPIASTELVLAGWQPVLESINDLFETAQFGDATVFVRVTAGAAVVGASRIDNRSMDPTTLVSWIDGDDDPLAAGTYYGVVLADTAASGGIALRVNGSGAVEGLEFSFPSDRCSVLFSAGQDLSLNPLPLTGLAAGHGFESSYPGGGVMAWTVELKLQQTGATLAGSIGATGSGWTGEEEACNGNHSPRSVEVGVREW